MAIFIVELIGCCALWFAVGYALGLRETKRRLKAHQEVTDRLMNADLSASTANRLTEHDDMINAASLSMLGGSHGGSSSLAAMLAQANSNTDFTQKMLRNQVGILGGASMQSPITYSATPSKFARTATSAGRPPTAAPRDGVKRKIYDDIKKAME